MKTILDVPVAIDELSLSLLGWQPVEARARVVTNHYGDEEYHHKISLSGTVRFLEEDWTDRFEDGDWAPQVLLAVGYGGPGGPTRYSCVVTERLERARNGRIRFAQESDTWITRGPVVARDIQLELTARDLTDLSSRIEVLGGSVRVLPTEVLDETSPTSMTVHFRRAIAGVVADTREGRLFVDLEGLVQFPTVGIPQGSLVRDDDWIGSRGTSTLPEYLGKRVPELEIEVLDETGFLLQKSGVFFTHGRVGATRSQCLPGRLPRMLVQLWNDTGDFAGRPERVLIRVVDPTYA